MNNKLYIFDTTLRDGEQVPGCQLNTTEKIEVARALEELGVDIIESGFPISSPEDFNSVQEISKAVQRPTICALSRAVEKDIEVAAEALKFAKRGRIHTGIGVSPYHIQDKFRATPEEIIRRGVNAVRFARNLVEEVEFYAEDAGRAENPYLAKMVEEVIKAGATIINIPDTTGYCLPHEYGEKIKYLIDNVPNIDKAILSTHCHNDLGMATANAMAGVLNGARQVEVTINGIGERAGNTALEEIVMTCHSHKKLGIHTDIQTQKLTEISHLVSSLMNMPVQPNKAIVGKNAFAHSSGIHQDGVLKNRETYEIINPKDVGVEESSIILTARSGRAALKHRIEKLGYRIEESEINEIYEAFLKIADKKKEVLDNDLATLCGKVYTQNTSIKMERLEVSTGNNQPSKASISLLINNQKNTATAEGQGPVDASIKAINSIVKKDVVLEDLLLQAVTKGSADLSKVHVRLSIQNKTYQGFGVHHDIVQSSVMAYLDALNKI